jgi:phosphatidate phosphatase APP1
MRHFSLHLHGLGSRFLEATRTFINRNDSYDHKLLTITSLITNSQRTFILIGDSGERDPLVNHPNDL